MDQNTVQILVYCVSGKNVRYLVLRRIPKKGGFWQPITGRVKPGEESRKGVLREIQEELGIPIKQLIDIDQFSNGQGEGKEFVFAAEVEPSADIRLDRPDVEHDLCQEPYTLM